MPLNKETKANHPVSDFISYDDEYYAKHASKDVDAKQTIKMLREEISTAK